MAYVKINASVGDEAVKLKNLLNFARNAINLYDEISGKMANMTDADTVEKNYGLPAGAGDSIKTAIITGMHNAIDREALLVILNMIG